MTLVQWLLDGMMRVHQAHCNISPEEFLLDASGHQLQRHIQVSAIEVESTSKHVMCSHPYCEVHTSSSLVVTTRRASGNSLDANRVPSLDT